MITRPYHRRFQHMKQSVSSFNSDRIDLISAHLDPYPRPDVSGRLPDLRPLANSLFDSRAAAVRAGVGEPETVIIEPSSGDFDPNALLERKKYEDPNITILIPTAKCLAVMAYLDYFQDDISTGELLRQMV